MDKPIKVNAPGTCPNCGKALIHDEEVNRYTCDNMECPNWWDYPILVDNYNQTMFCPYDHAVFKVTTLPNGTYYVEHRTKGKQWFEFYHVIEGDDWRSATLAFIINNHSPETMGYMPRIKELN